MPYLRIGIQLLLLFIPGSQLFGQLYHASIRPIGEAEGLSNYRVLSFLPDENGMWIGTQDGLNFFDGYNWQYWTQDEGQLSNQAVSFIHKDHEVELL